MKRRAIIEVSYELLENIFELPGDCTIIRDNVIVIGGEERPRSSLFFKDILKVAISGDKLPKIPEGSVIPILSIDEINKLYKEK